VHSIEVITNKPRLRSDEHVLRPAVVSVGGTGNGRVGVARGDEYRPPSRTQSLDQETNGVPGNVALLE
jgi:hypothetical protein